MQDRATHFAKLDAALRQRTPAQSAGLRLQEEAARMEELEAVLVGFEVQRAGALAELADLRRRAAKLHRGPPPPQQGRGRRTCA